MIKFLFLFLFSISLFAQWNFGNLPFGEATYTTPGVYNFTVPQGVFSISFVVVGSGGNPGFGGASRTGGGGGGALCWHGNYLVIPGQIIPITVGAEAQSSIFGPVTAGAGANGINTSGGFGYAAGGVGNPGGTGATCNTGGTGGAWTGSGNGYSSGGGGAAGYTGAGGRAGDSSGSSCPGGPGVGAGGGGGGGGGTCSPSNSGSGTACGGGGVGIIVKGRDGPAGGNQNVTGGTGQGSPGGGGSGGGSGGFGQQCCSVGGAGGLFGGGQGGGYYGADGASPGTGAVRIVWGPNYFYPSNSYIPQNEGTSPITGNPSSAFSLRKLNSTYTGPAVRVRRSSDNAETDIGFLSDGYFDLQTLQTFIGSGSAYVKIWYNQNGNGIHAIQNTTTAQPRIALNGVIGLSPRSNVPAIYFDGNHFLDTQRNAQLITNAGNEGTVFIVGTAANNSPYSFGVCNDPANDRWMAHWIWGTSNIYFDVGNLNNQRCITGAPPINIWKTWTFIKYTQTSEVYWSNLSMCPTYTSGGTQRFTGTQSFYIGWANGPGQGTKYIGSMSEFITYNFSVSRLELSNFNSKTMDFFGTP